MADQDIQRLAIHITGAVQGVGFRPFVYRLATRLDLIGWVNNSTAGVTLEVEGPAAALDQFVLSLRAEQPPLAQINDIHVTPCQPLGYTDFTITYSDHAGDKSVLVLPDVATCHECRRELLDPSNRRYRYPFTNCTNCGPRYSIIRDLPYDRPLTTMSDFPLCEDCRAEYENPANRRFHAQPNACPVCGPHLELWSPSGTVLARHGEALAMAVDAIRAGQIVAVKGLGGFHLMVDATRAESVQALRQRKYRPAKPLAVMFPSLEELQTMCHVDETATQLLLSPQAPIVLLSQRETTPIAEAVAPANPTLGAMLPYTPLHHLLMQAVGRPVVTTSGNRAGEPICTDEHTALERLNKLADLFLVHNRPIERPVDDSVVMIMAGREVILRRARGYAPLPIIYSGELAPILATGGHLKNTVAIARGQHIFVSQHIGDLSTAPAQDAFRQTIDAFCDLYDFRPEYIACDAHPDYVSTVYAQETGLPLIQVQHHVAHVLACMVDNQLEPPVLGIAWDGTGYGDDGTIWGGEALLIDDRLARDYQRVAHLRPFPLPGGELAIKEPRRSALGLLYAMYGAQAFDMTGLPPVAAFATAERQVLGQMCAKGLNTLQTSSMGRLIDGVAALIGLHQHNSFEAQAALGMEHLLAGIESDETYPFQLTATGVLDWEPMLEAILSDIWQQVAPPVISARLHNTLVEMIMTIAVQTGIPDIVLTGGCFQNKYLTEHAIQRLREQGFRPHWHRQLPPNDGGLAAGQILAAHFHIMQTTKKGQGQYVPRYSR